MRKFPDSSPSGQLPNKKEKRQQMLSLFKALIKVAEGSFRDRTVEDRFGHIKIKHFTKTKILPNLRRQNSICLRQKTATGCHTFRLRPSGFASPPFDGFADIYNLIIPYYLRKVNGFLKITVKKRRGKSLRVVFDLCAGIFRRRRDYFDVRKRFVVHFHVLRATLEGQRQHAEFAI